MKIPAVQAVICGVLSLWASTSGAQQQGEPRIALKLSAEAHEKQQADPHYITTLLQRAQPQVQAFRFVDPKVTVRPLIQSPSSTQFASRAANAANGPNFNVWYQIQLGSDSSNQARGADATAAQNTTGAGDGNVTLPKDALELIHALHKLDEVQSAHALYPGPPPAIDPSDDPRSTNQGYLNAAPQGINAPYGWQFPGGDGANVNVVDIEQGWNFNHEDLAAAGITLISGQNAAWFGHGTSVLGEMFMIDNQLGGIGIIPGAKGRAVSQHRDDWSYNTAEAILDAAAHMSFGDIMLLEAQEYDPVSGDYYWPVEIADANFEAIQAATAQGIIVVQAGCNGPYDLDTYVNLAGEKIFDRSSAGFRDSGSIMVGGSNSWVPHTRWYGSNHGSRMDVYAWAESVDTADTDSAGTESLYTAWFGGTSGASPIIVGAAAIIQGINVATRGFKLGPLEIRDILSNPAHGTPSADPATDRIGTMPDLQLIIDAVFNSTNQTADIYIRDHVSDVGDTTTGSVSASPDIIVRQQPILDPSIALGPGSGTEPNPSLSEPVISGQEHSLYIRLANRGTGAASAAEVTVYWSEPATLVTPNLWNEIGTLSITSVPAGDILTVSPRLAWPAASLPGTAGHYCFVALAGAQGDSAPALPSTFPDFVKFVRENNNVAWRNFNVISSPPNGTSNADGYHRFDVNVPGAWDGDREFTLKAVGKLPQGSSVRLSVPEGLAQAMHIKGCAKQHENKGEKAVTVGLQPAKVVTLGEGVLAKGSLAKCELQVKVPKGAYEDGGEHEFALLQEWEGVEVGRVTWRFGPVASL